MSAILFSICAVLAFLAVFLHEIFGAPPILGEVNKTGMGSGAKAMLNYSWHSDTILIFSMGTLFACAVFIPGNALMAWIGTGMSAGLGVMGILMAMFHDKVMWKTPAPYLWPLIALIGIAGLFSS